MTNDAGTKAIRLAEIRPGFFLNTEQIVSIRVLTLEEHNVYAVLQLSNGDKMNLTREEFSSITGEEARQPSRQVQQPPKA